MIKERLLSQQSLLYLYVTHFRTFAYVSRAYHIRLIGEGVAFMLTGRKLVFIGGDARQIEVITHTTELDASATLIGFDKLHTSFPDTVYAGLDPQVLGQADALVLPVAGMDDEGVIDTRFSDSPIQMTDDCFAALKPGTMVFTGIARNKLIQQCTAHDLNLVQLMELDEVAILNSIPTAEGAIALAMERTDITIHSSRTLVLGFGRCAQTLARTLGAMGARVCVGARNPADLARVTEMGFYGFPITKIETEIECADIIFNTIPHPVLTAAILAQTPRQAVIIDIASKPGGTDFRYAQRRGMQAILAPSLPGQVAPKTAGRIIATILTRLLMERVADSRKEESTWN